MNNPELYAQTNELPQKEVREFLQKHIHLIQWKQDGGGSAMDIGCGPGNITTEILLPMLPESLRDLVATDVSPEMIQYARIHHQHPRVSYDVLDIGTNKLPAVYYERFGQVFSFFCLHWVHDHRQAMENIFNMLQPGGDILLLYVSRHLLFDVILKLADLEHWKPYIKEPRRFVAVHYDVENVEESLYSLLQVVGFEHIVCECICKEYVYENINTFTVAAIAADPILAQLPAHLKEQYRQELCSELKSQAITEGYTKNETDNLRLPCTLIMIHARTP